MKKPKQKNKIDERFCIYCKSPAAVVDFSGVGTAVCVNEKCPRRGLVSAVWYNLDAVNKISNQEKVNKENGEKGGGKVLNEK